MNTTPTTPLGDIAGEIYTLCLVAENMLRDKVPTTKVKSK